MQVIPLQPIPAQILDVLLDDQATTLELRQLSTGIFMNILVDSIEVVGFTVCQNANRIVRNSYLGFKGDLMFLDNFGFNGKPPEDPYYQGLGAGDTSHFSLLYLTADEIAAFSFFPGS